MLRNVSKYSMKCPTSLCEAMVVLSLYKKRQIEYTQYVDNDVYVDDVDDNDVDVDVDDVDVDDDVDDNDCFVEDTAMPPSTVNYIECEGQPFHILYQ